jgi:hypothetical protein
MIPMPAELFDVIAMIVQEKRSDAQQLASLDPTSLGMPAIPLKKCREYLKMTMAA